MNVENKTELKDPVCGMSVTLDSEFHANYQGEMWYFCSQHCKHKFVQHPQAYTGESLQAQHVEACDDGSCSIEYLEYTCPMHPEIIQDHPGSCPKCGMALEPKDGSALKTKTEYTCPMHPEIVEDEMGSCPKCGMELVPMELDTSAEEKTYQRLLKKFWVASIFTIPIFFIAMSEMIPDNPLYKILDLKYWNWVQLGLSIPVVFYATWMFFRRA